jgi:excisionase family DNA binding protein
MPTTSFDIPEKRLFRPNEVANIFGVAIKTVYRWCDSGKMDFIRIGPRMMRVKRESVIKFIRISDDE